MPVQGVVLVPKQYSRMAFLQQIAMSCLISSLCIIAFSMFPMEPSTLASVAANSVVTTNETDHLSLLAFEREVTTDPYHVLSSWNSSLHFCSWPGVTCGRKHQRVTALNLAYSGLVGTLTPHLGNLTFLKFMNLSDNSFYGEIPQEVGRLFRLKSLVLANNSFQGGIPINLSNCSRLTSISLEGNRLEGGIPTELGSLLRLEYLNLEWNHNLDGTVPPSLGNLSSLTVLNLGGNNFTGTIPHQLGRLYKLEIFGLVENHLSGEVPLSIYNLSNIKAIEFTANYNLTGNLPPHIGTAFPRVEFFSVALNAMTGNIPNSLWNASNLRLVQLGNNNFVGSISTEIGKLASLRILNLDTNLLEGDILQFITSLTNCTRLTVLDAAYNNIHGLLPASIVNLSVHLTNLFLGRNNIYGTVHPNVGKLVNLEALVLNNNLLTGSIPSSIGELRNLNRLILINNRFTGQIPSSLGNLSQLHVLYLSGNLLSGFIQQSLSHCGNLEDLELTQNGLTGTIPPALAKCKKLLSLELGNNSLTGTIPSDLFSLSSLDYLDLSHNFLSGTLPPEIGMLSNIHMLKISDNQLYGRIPESLGNCLTLEFLYMDGNAFEGFIPQSVGDLRALHAVDLSHNKLEGPIPMYFGKLEQLEYLNLSHNDLKGEVPKEGIFLKASAISLEGNMKLCGGIAKLHFPTCTSGDGERSATKKVKVILLALAGSIIFIAALCIIFIWKRALRKKSLSKSSSRKQHMQVVSYREILNATDNFSPSNLIGIGSFGTVYKGVLNVHQMVIAVKVFNLKKVGASKSFIVECEALQNIRHRNLVKIFTCCSGYDYEGREFKALVYEFMENGTLESWLHDAENGSTAHHSRYLSLRDRLEIAIDVAHALDYLHNHCHTPIVHCDLKPTNILLDEDMVAHVSDFGLAKILPATDDGSSSLQLSSTSTIRGTVGYIPPEYGTTSNVTTEGDVFSYGVVLLEMLIGKQPTHEIFKDGLTISNYAKMAFPDQVMEIIDPLLLRLSSGEDVKIRSCIIAILEIGIECSASIPSNRIHMGIVKTKLELVREQLVHGGVEAKEQS